MVDAIASDEEPDHVSEHGAEKSRTILINEHHHEKFASNYITTGKYTLWSFLPSFIYEQFRRYSNVFFLFIALLQQIPDVSPTGKFTTLVPLITILSVSAMKEIVEDIKRHKCDAEVNNRIIEVLRGGSWHHTKWEHVYVGDFVKCLSEKFFPADIVLFSSSEEEGICYVETANLDGETNLKVKQGLPETANFDEHKFASLKGHIKCELPNRHLYEFAGMLKLNNGPNLALNHDQLLLRGAKLRNTPWIIGQVVYTGPETKLMKNSTAAPLKRSTVDKQTNHQIIMLFFLLILIAAVSAAFSVLWMEASNPWYSAPARQPSSGRSKEWNMFVAFSYSFLTFVILYNNLIPISLTVTLEVVRFMQALFINWDNDMYYAETDTPATARTSNLNEELGQVRYVFSDKTGTLTRNIMEFKACTVGGKVYPPESISEGKNLLVDNMLKKDPTAADIREFLVLLAVCHTVIPGYTNGEIEYNAASPDELALVLAAKSLGYVFVSRTPKFVEIMALDKKETYEILNVLEFTSTRKRMSIIVKTPEGRIKLMSKGADSVIYDLLVGGSTAVDPIRVQTLDHLEEFAKQGLRTLCCAVAEISQRDYQQWQGIFHEASTAINQREKKLENASSLIEKDLRLVGATAIEDKLQDKVPETIAALLQAGIHVWVLTGDKQETAINIGYSCRLLKQSMELLIVNCENAAETGVTLNNHIQSISIHNHGVLPEITEAAVIIDGKSLKYALMDDLRPLFLLLCCGCRAVICCRASPLQKAEIVEYVTHYTGKITLAIGDGANDVAMIQKAHVGIGISGQEGLQASSASDYAIAQFHFLHKLLFVHGAWNYDRICKVIFYSYYKNICLYLVELWFAIYSAWSGQIIFDRWTIGFYNMMFTCAQPLAMGVFDRNCSEQLRLRFPILYHPSEHTFSLRTCLLWIGNAVMHSIVLYWLPYLIYGEGIVVDNGRKGGYLVLGNFIYTYVVIVVSLKSGLETKSWTIFAHLSIWGSIIFWMVFLFGYSYLYTLKRIPAAADIVGIAWMIYLSPVFWAGLIVVPLATLLPDIIKKAVESTCCLSIEERFRQCDIRHKDPSVFLKEESSENSQDVNYTPDIDSFIRGGDESAYTYSTGSSMTSVGTLRDEIEFLDTDVSHDPEKRRKKKSRRRRSKKKKKKRDLSHPDDGDKPTDFSKLILKVEAGELNRNFIHDSKQIRKTLTFQKTKVTHKTLLGSENSPSITHPSTHPSINQTRTKLGAGMPSTEPQSLSSERQEELRAVLQQWTERNRKKTLTSNIEEQRGYINT